MVMDGYEGYVGRERDQVGGLGARDSELPLEAQERLYGTRQRALAEQLGILLGLPDTFEFEPYRIAYHDHI